MVQGLKAGPKVLKAFFIDPDLRNLHFKFHQSISYQAKVGAVSSSFCSQQIM